MGIQAANAVYNQARETMEELHHTLMHNKQNNSNGEASTASFTANKSAVDSRQDVTRLACECEAIAVQQAALHRYHNSVDVFPLATLRQTLTSAITTWPGCAPLWSIYVQVSQGPFFKISTFIRLWIQTWCRYCHQATSLCRKMCPTHSLNHPVAGYFAMLTSSNLRFQVENRYHSAGRARRFFHSVTRDSCSVVPRLFAIVAEQQRKQLVDAAVRWGQKGWWVDARLQCTHQINIITMSEDTIKITQS